MPTHLAPGPLALKLRYGGAAALAAAIFTVDSFTTLGSAVAVLYVLVLIVVAETASGRVVRACTAGCRALTLLSFVYVHGLEARLEVVLRVLFSLSVILATAFLTLQRHRSDLALRRSEQRFRTIFETLAVASWEHDLRPVKAALDQLRAQGVDDLGAYLSQNPAFVTKMRGMIRVTDVNGTALALMGAPSKDLFFTRLDRHGPRPRHVPHGHSCAWRRDPHRPAG